MDVAAQPHPVPGGTAHGRASRAAFFSIPVLLCATSIGGTIAFSRSMAGVGGMPMPGGWTLSMAWMRMPGQTWPGVAAAFLGMWLLMMVAMMLPAITPMLWRYRQAISGMARPGRLTAVAGAGYFAVWTLYAMALFPLGIALAQLEMQSPALARVVPGATALIVLIAGSLQLTGWKAHQLACCQVLPAGVSRVPVKAATAWRHGMTLGLQCSRCCGNLMVILLVTGLMDLRWMAAATVAITAERLVPAAGRVVRAIGAFAIAAGAFLIARAAGL